MVYKGGRQQIIDALLINAEVWKYCHIFNLTTNMCLHILNNLNNVYDDWRELSKWVLDIGNGTAELVSVDNNDERNWIKIPQDLLLDKMHAENEDIAKLMKAVYSEFIQMNTDKFYLQERAILAPTNDDVDKINDIVLRMQPCETKIYLSANSITNIHDNKKNSLYTPEFLHTLKFSSLPNHTLKT